MSSLQPQRSSVCALVLLLDLRVRAIGRVQGALHSARACVVSDSRSGRSLSGHGFDPSMAGADKIVLRGLVFQGYHGVLPEAGPGHLLVSTVACPQARPQRSLKFFKSLNSLKSLPPKAPYMKDSLLSAGNCSGTEVCGERKLGLQSSESWHIG